MKNILIPTDFSKNAKAALMYALSVFDNQETIHLLHIYEKPQSTGMLISIADIVKKDAEDGIKAELKYLTDNGINISRIKTKIISGDFEFELERFSKDNAIDIIIMGTKGASGLQEILIGSNTANVIKKAIKPLIAVPVSCTNKPKNILLPLDFAHLNSIEVLAPLKEIATKNNSKIDVLYISRSDSSINQADIRSKINSYFGDIEPTFNYIESNEIANTINDFASEHKSDLITMIPRKGNFFDSIFHKSITNKIAITTNIPLLAINDLTY